MTMTETAPPERVWVCPDLQVQEDGSKEPDWECGTFWEGDEPDYPHGTHFVRADLLDEALLREAELVKALEEMIDFFRGDPAGDDDEGNAHIDKARATLAKLRSKT